MAKASRPKPTHATDSAPAMDIGAAMREAAEPVPARVPDQGPRERSTAPSRSGRKGVVGYVAPELWAQLRHLAIDERSSIQALVLEGLDRVLEARGITLKTND